MIENSLAALVIECLPLAEIRLPQEIMRLKQLGRTAQSCFLFLTPRDALWKSLPGEGAKKGESVLLQHADQEKAFERFVVIADHQFSALLASVPGEARDEASPEDLVIWTFEPDIVYSALEYLMARVTAEYPSHGHSFAKAVQVSTPKATSVQLTLGVTTKLARLLQGQAAREIAVSNIAQANADSCELEDVMQVAANAVGRALNVQCCAIRLQGELVGEEITTSCFAPDLSRDTAANLFLADIDEIGASLAKVPSTCVVDGNHPGVESQFGQAILPLIHRGGFGGFLLVRTNDPLRVWADSELMLLRTVAAQLAVAVNQAQLSAQLKEQALTDALTGCYNRRAFELQLERDLHLATRMRQPLSLIMLDLDNFKNINDRAGHDTGDTALRILADALRSELRAVDTAVRFGGDEFAIILPQANMEGGIIVAERLRNRIEQTEVPGYGRMTASFGLATFPVHASSRDTLVVAADRALYRSKHSGRNRVSVPLDEPAEAFSSRVKEEILISPLG
ncbi:MAG: diguanylate cyclase [Pyrinomonadaceae bacterium]